VTVGHTCALARVSHTHTLTHTHTHTHTHLHKHIHPHTHTHTPHCFVFRRFVFRISNPCPCGLYVVGLLFAPQCPLTHCCVLLGFYQRFSLSVPSLSPSLPLSLSLS